MEFIFSQALWFLPLATLPIIFNIINNRQFKTIDFSEIKFIESLKSDSIKKLNLINLLLLLLRILIILLLIFTISRPIFQTNSRSLSASDSSTTIVVLIDDSYSNLNKDIYDSQISLINKALEEIIAQYNPSTNIEISSINSGLIYSNLLSNFSLSDLQLSSTYKDGDMWTLMQSYFEGEMRTKYVNGDMYVISDMDESSFEGMSDEGWWNIAFININPNLKAPNITDIVFSKEIILPDEDFFINVTVQNNGDRDYRGISAYLYIGDQSYIPSGEFDILSNTKKEIAFNGIRSSKDAKIRLELKDGEERLGRVVYSKINVSPKINIGFLDVSDINTKVFLKGAIKSIKKEQIEIGSPSLNYSNLRSYDIVIIDNLSYLENSDLIRYFKQGGHVIVFPNIKSSKDYNLLLEGLSIDIKYEKFVRFVEKENVIDLNLKNQIFNKTNKEKLFSINKFFSLPLSAESVIEVGDRSIWNRYQINQGLVDIIGIDLNISNGDFPLQASFIPFVHNLLLSNQNKQVYVDISSNLRDRVFVSKTLFPLNLEKDSIAIESFDRYTQRISLNSIEEPGYYNLTSSKDKIKSYIANISPSELSYDAINLEAVKSLFNQNMYEYSSVNGDFEELGNIISKKIKGVEIWPILLFLAIFLLIVESLIIGVYQRRY